MNGKNFSMSKFWSSWFVKLDEMGFLLLLARIGVAQVQFSAEKN